MGVHCLRSLVCDKGDDPIPINKRFYRHRIVAGLALVLIMFSFLVVYIARIQPTKNEPTKSARFVLSEWEEPDQYGQGIDIIHFYENSTGSWVAAPWYYRGGALDGLPYYALHSYDPYTLNWTAGVAMKLRITSQFNKTTTGVSTVAEGKNYHQHNVTVTDNVQQVFFQQNFTYYDGTEYDNMIQYKYEVVLDFLPLDLTNYVIDIDYEIYFEGSEQGGPYLHDCSNTDGIVYDSNSGLGGGDYGIGSDGDAVEIWIIPDSVSDEKVIYKLDFTNIDNSDGDVNLTVRYRVEDGFIGFRLDLYYDDATSDSIGTRFSQTWENQTIDADTKTLDYVLLYCDDYPSSVSSGNRSVYVDFVEITSETGSLTYTLDRWNDVTDMELYFHVEIHEWGMNTAFILFGLILIPISGLYLSYSVRKGLTADRGFYFLLIFLFGVGLFIGGIMVS